MKIIATLFHAVLGVSLALYILYPRETMTWLRLHVTTILAHQCDTTHASSNDAPDKTRKAMPCAKE